MYKKKTWHQMHVLYPDPSLLLCLRITYEKKVTILRYNVGLRSTRTYRALVISFSILMANAVSIHDSIDHAFVHSTKWRFQRATILSIFANVSEKRKKSYEMSYSHSRKFCACVYICEKDWLKMSAANKLKLCGQFESVRSKHKQNMHPLLAC